MSIYQSSRYSLSTTFFRGDGKLVLPLRRKVCFNKKVAKQYTVKQGDSSDSIAYNEYGNAQLNWAILDANDYLNDLEMSAGDVIYIPPYEEVVLHCV